MLKQNPQLQQIAIKKQAKIAEKVAEHTFVQFLHDWMDSFIAQDVINSLMYMRDESNVFPYNLYGLIGQDFIADQIMAIREHIISDYEIDLDIMPRGYHLTLQAGSTDKIYELTPWAEGGVPDYGTDSWYDALAGGILSTESESTRYLSVVYRVAEGRSWFTARGRLAKGIMVNTSKLPLFEVPPTDPIANALLGIGGEEALISRVKRAIKTWQF